MIDYNEWDPYAGDKELQEQMALSQQLQAGYGNLPSQQQGEGAQQGEGMNPMQMYNMYNQFAGGGSAAAGGGGAAAGGGSAAAGGGSAAAGGGSAAAGGGGSAIAAGGPIALLVAAILGNEENARKKDFRDEDTKDRTIDQFSGKVVEQDLDRWVPKVFGNNDKTGLGEATRAGADLATLDFSNAWKHAKGSPIMRGLRSIF